MSMRGRAAAWGAAAVTMVALWQFLTVRYNYGGNWTGLFCIAAHMPKPDFLRSETLYIFVGSDGYDGQVYHLIAHDPWLRRGSANAIIGPAVFYQRILVPALAWSLALGRDEWIHPAYIAVVLGFIFLGVFWSAHIVARAGLNPAWGLAFVLTPATLTSIDRMTVDVALAACVAGFAWYAAKGPDWKVFVLLACAVLIKEQAAPIVLGYALYLATRRRFAGAAWTLAAALPALLWFVYLWHAWPAPPLTAGNAVWKVARGVGMSWVPLAGFFDITAHPAAYHFTPFKNAAGVTFDYVALAGYAIALGLAIRYALERRWNPQVAAAFGLAISTMAVRNPLMWTAYNFGRGFTPFFLLLAIEELPEQAWLAALPMLLVDLRIALNFVSQVQGVGLALLK